MTIALVIPTYNAEQELPLLLTQVFKQSLLPDHILIIDSSSSDKTQQLVAHYPVTLHVIEKKNFDHGGTRKLALELVNADIYIYLTQDAVPASDDTFYHLIKGLKVSDQIGCAYGRQLPKKEATPLSAHARLFNYPAVSQIKYFSDIPRYGIKTCFNSDSFAAYKRKALIESGNFPINIISGEDVYVAAKMLKKGYAIAYVAEATVYHSHNLSIREEFHRYFSIGVFHAREKALLSDFNSATGEGIRFVKSELLYLIQKKRWGLIPHSLISTLVKFLAYKLGLYENSIPLPIKKRMGINRSFWSNTLKA